MPRTESYSQRVEVRRPFARQLRLKAARSCPPRPSDRSVILSRRPNRGELFFSSPTSHVRRTSWPIGPTRERRSGISSNGVPVSSGHQHRQLHHQGNVPAVRRRLVKVPMAQVAISTVTEVSSLWRGPAPRCGEPAHSRSRIPAAARDSALGSGGRATVREPPGIARTRRTPMGNLDMMIAAQALASDLVLSPMTSVQAAQETEDRRLDQAVTRVRKPSSVGSRTASPPASAPTPPQTRRLFGSAPQLHQRLHQFLAALESALVDQAPLLPRQPAAQAVEPFQATPTV